MYSSAGAFRPKVALIPLVFMGCLGASAAWVWGQSLVPGKDEKLDGIAQAAIKRFELPGMCCAIVEGNRRLRVGAGGVRRIGAPDAISVNDRFHVGSCTKAMTATAIAGVVRDTRLDWDSTLATVLPDVAAKTHPSYRKVTLRQLLEHRSGLPANSDLMWRVDRKLPTTAQRKLLFGEILKSKPDSEPGIRHEYSNLGYMLAALMAEQTARKSWEELMKQNLFEPLGMKSVGYGPPATAGRTDQPWGQRLEGSTLKPTDVDNPPVLGPAGTVHCSIADWARFAALHLGHAPEIPKAKARRQGPAFDAPTIQFLHQPLAGHEYVFGWIPAEREWGKGSVLTHSGSNRAWYATIWLAPNIDRAFLAITNTGQENAAEACDSVIAAMIQLSEP